MEVRHLEAATAVDFEGARRKSRPHLARGFDRECQAQHSPRSGMGAADLIGGNLGEQTGFARTGTGYDEQASLRGLDGNGELLVVQLAFENLH
jgi:hypothetical protein